MDNSKSSGTPMSPSTALEEKRNGKSVDITMYRGMIGSLMYLTTNRPDIMFSVYKCIRYQSTLRESYLTAVKCIIRYLINTSEFGLWYLTLIILITNDSHMQTLQVTKITERSLVDVLIIGKCSNIIA